MLDCIETIIKDFRVYWVIKELTLECVKTFSRPDSLNPVDCHLRRKAQG
jgi:hypothetical protein